MRQRTLVTLFLIALVPVAIAIGSPGDDPPAPIILSAIVDGDHLVIRGAGLTAGAEPFVTLSGEPLEIRPEFSDFEVRARLPKVAPGSYLLTLATGRHAPQAATLAVSITKTHPAARSDATTVPVCVRRRHMRVVQSSGECKRNETFMELDASGAEPGKGDDDDLDSDDDSDGDSDDVDSDSDDVDSDSDSDSDDVDSDSDSADSDGDSDSDDEGRGNGQGNGNGRGNGNGNDGDSDSDSDD